MISIIAGMDRNRNIGFNGDMPWGKGMKSDLKRFKELTMDKHVIMGRKTLESLPNSLPRRQCHVLSRQKMVMGGPAPWMNPNWHGHNSIESVLEAIKDEDAFVIGGAQIYEQFMPYADRIYLTKVHAYLEGDTKFPSIVGKWNVINHSLHPADENNLYPWEFITYERG